MERLRILEGLAHDPSVEVLVVGGGINGSGVFRDLALQGIRVLLVERGDFCSGASSASSHMAHGGIRYLENGEFRLVREAIVERGRLIANAPHLVRPLPTVIPLFKFFSGLLNAPFKFVNLLDKPAERGAVVIKVGLSFYDAFSQDRGAVPRHRFETRKASLDRFPSLNPKVRFTATYFDGQLLSPERLAVEILLDGEAEGDHARALNHVSMEGGDAASGGVVLRDGLTGKTLTVKPRVIINAAGPWIDRVNSGFGLDRHYIGGTKGSHIVLDHPELRKAIGDNEFFFENSDGRIVLIFPWFDRVIVGTSDLPCDDPDTTVCTEEEVDYFIGLTARVFPAIRIAREHIIFTFSGVRPLLFSKATTTAQITRDHVTFEDRFGEAPVLSLVGGKWTTFRAFAEQATDRVLAILGKGRVTGTAELGVGGGRDWPAAADAAAALVAELAGIGGMGPERAQILWNRYGTRARELATAIAAEGPEPLASRPTWARAEITFLVRREKALRLDDLLLRRSTLAWLGGLDRPFVAEIAAIMGTALGWSAADTEQEIERTLELLRNRHGLHVG